MEATRYEMGELLRESELGRIYVAKDPSEAETMACELWVVDDTLLRGRGARKRLVDRMRRFIKGRPGSPWVDLYEEDKRVVLVHRVLGEKTLRDVMVQEGALDWKRAAEIGANIARELAVIHRDEAANVHGDLRPENIFIAGTGVALAGAGLAQALDDVSEDGVRSLGRLRYLSPEQVAFAQAGSQSDVYALGMILVELMTGEAVFKQSTAQEVESAKEAFVPRWPKRLEQVLPEALLSLLSSLCASEPEARPQLVADVAQVLEATLTRTQSCRGASEQEILSSYVARVMEVGAQRNSALKDEELREIAIELGMSEADLQAADKAAADHLTRGQGYLSHQLWDDAIEQLQSAASLAPARTEVVFALAEAHAGRWSVRRQQQDKLEAQRLARRVIDLDARHAEAFKLLAELESEGDDGSEKGSKRAVVPRRRGRSPKRGRVVSLGQMAVIGVISALLGLVVLLFIDPLEGWMMRPLPTQPTVESVPSVSVPSHPVVGADAGVPAPPTTAITAPMPADLASQWTSPDGAVMLRVAEAAVTLGGGESGPERRAVVPSFYMDLHEVTVASFRHCVRDGACAAHLYTPWSPRHDACNYGTNRDDHPMNCVSGEGAEQFCAWRARRSGRAMSLPTEAQWEYAARGPERRLYPWGDSPGSCATSHRGGCQHQSTRPVRSYPVDLSPLGFFDLGGNVAEWVSISGGDGTESRSVRGGSWLRRQAINSAERESVPVPLGYSGVNAQEIGFRCASPAL